MIAGMAGSISGMMHAPLTGIFLSAEITGGYVLIVPLMIVAATTYFINKGVLNYSIYTKSLAVQGSLLTQENKDHRIIRRLKLKYLLETDFVILNEEDTPKSRSRDIVHTTRNVFPVVDNKGVLKGIITSDQLLEYIVDTESENKNRRIKELAQATGKVITIDTNMFEVMQIMESKDLRILPVVCEDGKYLGFVTKNAIFNKYRALLMRDSEY
jgi:CIC family chloride channel protein